MEVKKFVYLFNVCWEWKLKFKQMILEDKIKQSTMGEVAHNEARLEHIKLQHDVFVADLELTNLEREEVVVST